jgi:hypothetical protein
LVADPTEDRGIRRAVDPKFCCLTGMVLCFKSPPEPLYTPGLDKHEGFLILKRVILSSVRFTVFTMGRFNRVVALDIPHHVTQRGNGRRFILDCDDDRTVYLKLLRENMALHGVGLVGYCLMSNHVHLITIPAKADGLAEALVAVIALRRK